MNCAWKREDSSVCRLRSLMWVIAISSMLFAVACGGDAAPPGSSSEYPSGIGNDIYKQLKYDARVEDYEESGNTLVVNVNDSWTSSPPGIRARSLGQWYSLWQASHGTGSKIVVKHEGNEIDSWNAEKGYQPASDEKKNSSEG
jgi:hypothetical protein